MSALCPYRDPKEETDLTNKQFWKKLADIMKKPQNDGTTIEMIQTLLQTGDEDLAVLALCVQEGNDPNGARQLYAGPSNARIMLCYTSEDEAKKERRMLPSGDKRKIKCLPLRVRDVVNNALMKDSIVALAFDPENKHGYILPKQMIMMVVEVMDDIESGRIDPKDYMRPGMGGAGLPS